MWLWIPRKESQMDHGQLSMVADKFQWVFSEALLNACGTDVKFCRRQRVITPFRLGLALTATCASQRLEYDYRDSKTPGMPVTGGRGFRSLKPLWHIVSCLK